MLKYPFWKGQLRFGPLHEMLCEPQLYSIHLEM